MSLPRLPLYLVLGGAAVVSAVVCAAAPGPEGVAAPFAFLLALWLPGHAIAAAFLPDRGRDRVRLACLALGLSLAIAIVLAVELAAYGALAAGTWAPLLAAVTVWACVVVHRRTRTHPVTASRRPRPRIRMGAVALGALAVLATAAAFGVARTPLPVPDDRGYTVMSIAPAAADPRAAIVTVRSEEAAERAFTLLLDGPGDAKRSREITLRPGETLQARIGVPAGFAGTVGARLVNPSQTPPAVYRRVRITFPLLEPAPVVDRESTG